MDDLRRQGIEHFNAGRFEEASRCFRAEIAAGGGGPEARCLLAHALDSAAQPQEAAAEFAAALEAFPSHQPAYRGLASLVLRRGALPGAAAALRGALALRPRRAARGGLIETLRLCARAWRASDDLESAEEALQNALRLAPGDKESRRRFLGILRVREQAFLSAGRLGPAEEVRRRALALEPRKKKSLRGRVEALRRGGLAHAWAGRLGEAERTLRRALALAPRDERTRRRLIELLRRRAQSLRAHKPEAEEKVLRKALALEPRDRLTRERLLDALRRRAQALLAAGELQGAQRILRRALVFEPEDRGTRALIVSVLRLRARAQPSALQAEKSLRRALTLSPKDAEARGDLARILRARAISYDVPNARSRFLCALQAWKAVLKASPRDGSAWVSLSLLMRWIGRPKQERAALRRAVAKGSELSRADRFKALMRLGRYANAVWLAERMLDGSVSVPDLRAFWDPWEQNNRPLREAPQTDLGALDRALKSAPGPWRQFYLGCLRGPEGLGHFDALPSGARYRWMHCNAAKEALFSGSFRRAVRSFKIALRHEPMDWPARCFLAEAYVCLDEPAQARREMARGLQAAPETERAQVHAWWGELELWLGDYEAALERSTRACSLGAPFAHGWKGAALLKLGRREEALAQLDRALRLYPNDAEARLWRAEAKRELGRCREALRDLEGVSALSVWVLFNRALARRALGDEAGMIADFESLPKKVVDHVRRRIGLPGARPLDAGQMSRILEAGLKLARGFRRDEYGQAVWLSRRSG
ncbi:MAG: tetratricopeptide repeat protein [Elusimicrobia bacterium]|nr:tetratricopeptide repeat protein [Elusimicrobiota bacterium]